MVQMKPSAAGSADMGMLEDLQMAVSLHQLDDALTVLWANTAFYQMLGKKQEDFKESLVFSSCFSDVIQDFQKLYSSLCAADECGQRQVKLRSSMRIADDVRMVEIAGTIRDAKQGGQDPDHPGVHGHPFCGGSELQDAVRGGEGDKGEGDYIR